MLEPSLSLPSFPFFSPFVSPLPLFLPFLPFPLFFSENANQLNTRLLRHNIIDGTDLRGRGDTNVCICAHICKRCLRGLLPTDATATATATTTDNHNANANANANPTTINADNSRGGGGIKKGVSPKNTRRFLTSQCNTLSILCYQFRNSCARAIVLTRLCTGVSVGLKPSVCTSLALCCGSSPSLSLTATTASHCDALGVQSN